MTASPVRLSDGRLVVRHGTSEYEIPEHCPHLGAPLDQAYLNGPFLRCAWHGATFDVRTGERLRGPACPNLPTPGPNLPTPGK
ncbi:Rieske (2Fe-2S) protein [Actinomadura barringtoniae]|uniref:Rieske (2Fe-2S) protein n=1 Tax=Actinomadura barringtoniae TaxID=1427535 RepID=A0A939P9T4_9ACTN|nr:Rieske (2Fe-2S) protein [Actinomadura barringtoniae]MBO2448580.1 Rieske (2Fe-2S) protein [Actinomadura barringtoniae]